MTFFLGIRSAHRDASSGARLAPGARSQGAHFSHSNPLRRGGGCRIIEHTMRLFTAALRPLWLFPLAVILPACSHAEWLPLGNPVSVVHWYSVQPRLVADERGGAFVMWTFQENAGVQAFTRDGDLRPGWPAAGVVPPPPADPWTHWLISPVAHVADGQDGLYVLTAQSGPCQAHCGAEREGVFALQHLTPDGSLAPGWPDSGRPVFDDLRDLFAYQRSKMVSAGANGVIVLASEGWPRFPFFVPQLKRVRVQAVGPDGARPWGGSGVVVAEGLGLDFTLLLADDRGGAFVFWADSDSAAGNLVRAQHVSAEGRLLWNHGGRTISRLRISELTGLVAAGDGDHGVIVAWISGSGTSRNPFAARLTKDGELPWSQERPLRSFSGDASNLGIAPTHEGGAIASWHEATSARPRGVYAQRVLKRGEMAWPADGVSVCTATGDHESPRLASDGHDGAYVVWADSRPAGKLYATHLTGSGNPHDGWPADGSPISAVQDADGGPTSLVDPPTVAATGNEEAMVAWDSYQTVPGRPNGSLLEQCFVTQLTPDGPAVPSPSPPASSAKRAGFPLSESQRLLATFALIGTRPNPAHAAATIRFALPDESPAMLELHDIAGRRVWSREVGTLGAGVHELPLRDGESTSPGLYLIRLRQGPRTATLPLVVVR
jgi:hypothetical protein